MNIKLLANIVGSLFPVIFPKQQFKPVRLVGFVIAFIIIAGSVQLMGKDTTEDIVDIVEDVLEATEEQ